jgi:hypothetical protein
MEHGSEQTRLDKLLMEAYQGDIWAFAADQAFTKYQELLARIDAVNHELNCFRDEWKQYKLNQTVKYSGPLSPRHIEKIKQQIQTSKKIYSSKG